MELKPPEPKLWLKCLDEWFDGDAPSITLTHEVLGYLVSPLTTAQKIFLIVGPRRSGKGTIFYIIDRLLGTPNVGSTTFDKLGQPFGLEPLLGKSVAAIPDARMSAKADVAMIVERLLSISGGDTQAVARKFKTDVLTRMPIRFLIASNETPQLRDASGAVASRFVVLRTVRSFLGKEDPGLIGKLLPELPGILVHAAKAFVRLQANDFRFTATKLAQCITRQLGELSAPVAQFGSDHCIFDPAAEIACDDMFQAWLDWCEERDIKVGPKPSFAETSGTENVGPESVDRAARTWFGRMLAKTYPDITKHRPRDGCSRVWKYRGVRLRSKMTKNCQSQRNPLTISALIRQK